MRAGTYRFAGTSSLPLAPGSALGGYTIIAAIGAGGMGQVYRARDGRLNRDVALKILPPDAADAERLQRFEREAQIVASLNHPNVVTVHSVEQSGGLHFLTMELVEGATLGDIIPPGGMPIGRLFQIAIPLADAVGAAHARGVIHRDLKPGNVMVTADGRVKVLDFGLAKLRPAEAVLSDLSTISRHDLTVSGRILGTLAYMSPEQAEGRDVDHRSDVFSLGVILHELATGTRPFVGASSAALLSAILRDTPAPVNELRPELPAELSRLIRRCLAKDLDRRLQSVIDLRNELDEIRQRIESDNPAVNARSTAIAIRRRQNRPLFWGAGLVLLVAGAGLAAAFVWQRPDDTDLKRSFRLNVQPPSGVDLPDQGPEVILATSPDSRWIAYRGSSADEDKSGLYLRSTTEPVDRRVWDAGGGTPFFSHDSRWLGFQANKAIWKVAVTGGKFEQICETSNELRGASWADDGSIVFWMTDRLWRIRPGEKTPVPVTQPDARSYFFPHVLPGSRLALVTVFPQIEVGVLSLENGALIKTLFKGSSARYVRDGFLVFTRLETLYAIPFELGGLEVGGDEQAIGDDVSSNEGGAPTAAFDVANSGALIYMRRDRDEKAELVWFDGENQTRPVVQKRQDYRLPVLSPDKTRVAMHIATAGVSDLWVYHLTKQSWLRLTTGSKTDGSIVWSPDGNWLVFTCVSGGGSNRLQRELFRVASDRAEPVKLTSANPIGRFGAYDYASSIYENQVMFRRQVDNAEYDLLTVPLDRHGAETIFVDSGPLVQASNAQFSPDGRWVAYESVEANVRHIFVRPRSGPGKQTMVADGVVLGWSREDGGKLFFSYRTNDEIWRGPVTSGPTIGEFVFGPKKRVNKDDWFRGQIGVKRNDERQLIFVTRWLDEMRASSRR
jgi:serine/threonine protein kinase